MALKFKKDDLVEVITGKDIGKQGKIVKVLVAQQRLVVEEINLAKKHQKPTKEGKGEILSFSAPIHWSNVKLVCPKTNKPTRVAFVDQDGVKKRKAKVSGEFL